MYMAETVTVTVMAWQAARRAGSIAQKNMPSQHCCELS
jgi:hypothetical protein